MKTVDYREYNRALKELRAELQVQTGGLNVELCEMNGCEQPVQLGVNWAGIGTVSIDKAKDFATAISNAAGLADRAAADELIASARALEAEAAAAEEEILRVVDSKI